MSDRKMLTAETWAEVQKNGLIRVSMWIGDVLGDGAHMTGYLTERGARKLAKQITEALDNRPRVVSAADLGIEDAA